MAAGRKNIRIEQGATYLESFVYRENKQKVSFTAAPTTGTFTLRFLNYVTAAISFDATDAQIQTALEQLPSIGGGNVTVAGSVGGPFIIEFTAMVERLAYNDALSGMHPLLIGVSSLEPLEAQVKVEYAPVDLTGASAEMHVRKNISDVATLFDVSTSNGGIILGGTDGSITVIINSTDTEALDLWGDNQKRVQGVYDLEVLFPTSIKERLVEGKVDFVREVTRDGP